MVFHGPVLLIPPCPGYTVSLLIKHLNSSATRMECKQTAQSIVVSIQRGEGRILGLQSSIQKDVSGTSIHSQFFTGWASVPRFLSPPQPPPTNPSSPIKISNEKVKSLSVFQKQNFNEWSLIHKCNQHQNWRWNGYLSKSINLIPGPVFFFFFFGLISALIPTVPVAESEIRGKGQVGLRAGRTQIKIMLKIFSKSRQMEGSWEVSQS